MSRLATAETANGRLALGRCRAMQLAKSDYTADCVANVWDAALGPRAALVKEFVDRLVRFVAQALAKPSQGPGQARSSASEDDAADGAGMAHLSLLAPVAALTSALQPFDHGLPCDPSGVASASCMSLALKSTP